MKIGLRGLTNLSALQYETTFQKAMKMGAKIAFVTDVGAYDHCTSMREFLKLVQHEMKPVEAIIERRSD